MILEDQQNGAEADNFGLMFCLQQDGSYATTEHDISLLSFEHGGMTITNPCQDESTVVSVDPRYYGFREVNYGAGAALRYDLEGGEFLLLTYLGDLEPARLSRCNSSGMVIAYCFLADVP